MPKIFEKINLTKLDYFSIINITAKAHGCTCRGSVHMRLILSLFLLSNVAFGYDVGEQNWGSMTGSLGTAVGSTTAAVIQQRKLIKEAEAGLEEKGIEPDLCKEWSAHIKYADTWLEEGGNLGDAGEGTCAYPTGGWLNSEAGILCVVKKDDNNSKCTQQACCSGTLGLAECFRANCKGTELPVSQITAGVKENCRLCKAYIKLKSSSSFGADTIGSLIGLVGQIGGAMLAPGCDENCSGLAGKPRTRCLCQATGRDGKPCMNPQSADCKAAERVTCEEQLVGMSCGADCGAILLACQCGERNVVDTTGGWHMNEFGVCVNKKNEVAGNNNNGSNVTPDYGSGDAYKDKYKNDAATSSAANNGSGSGKAGSSGLTLGSASSKGFGNNNSSKDKEKPSLTAETGHGSGKGSLGMAGGNEGTPYGMGTGEGFTAKKKEKVAKDIAKADGETIFALVTAVYKNMVDANALDSTRKAAKLKTDTKKLKKKKA